MRRRTFLAAGAAATVPAIAGCSGGLLGPSQEQVDELQTQLNTTREELAAVRTDLNSTEAELNQTESELQTARETVNETKREAASLESELEAAKEQTEIERKQSLLRDYSWSLSLQQDALENRNQINEPFNNGNYQLARQYAFGANELYRFAWGLAGNAYEKSVEFGYTSVTDYCRSMEERMEQMTLATADYYDGLTLIVDGQRSEGVEYINRGDEKDSAAQESNPPDLGALETELGVAYETGSDDEFDLSTVA